MKPTLPAVLFLATATLFPFAPSPANAQSFDATDAAKNRAIAASPRTREAFPWLTRVAPTPAKAVAPEAGSDVVGNRGLAAAPRTLEAHPELNRVEPAPGEFTVAPFVERRLPALSSPRAEEQFPELSRGTAAGAGPASGAEPTPPRK